MAWQVARQRQHRQGRSHGVQCRAERRPGPGYEFNVLSLIVGLGLYQMVSAGLYRALYCISPTLQLIASQVDEVADPSL